MRVENNNDNNVPSKLVTMVSVLIGLVVLLLGVKLGYDGLQLAGIGGSIYYVVVGLALLVSGVLLCLRHVYGVYAYFAMFVVSIIWAITDAGFQFWPLAARLGLFAVLGIFVVLLAPKLKGGTACRHIKLVSVGVALLLVIGVVGAFIKSFSPIWLVKPDNSIALSNNPVADEPANWTNYGRTPDGTQFSPETQINKDNVSKLKVAWTFRTNDFAFGGAENQNTPLQIGDTLYACSPSNIVFALDANTGTQKWKFDPKVNSASSPTWMRCRSVAYYDTSEAPAFSAQLASTPSVCAARIYVTTADLRLIGLDAQTGELCKDFGKNGVVSLSEGMGQIVPGFYNPTSGPVMAGDVIIVGGWVMDNQSTDEPSGAVRAFNAKTGELAWAWDIGRPDSTAPLQEGEIYTRSTPNVWAVPTYDSELGLVYLPTGNPTPDMYGASRTPEMERVSSSIVAVDVHTGKEKWAFQTVHHDLWDYDLPSKPVLYDVPDGNGKRIPALIQTTKRGEIFVLDRRTGEPITEVVEKAVPAGNVPGERYSPTQPYSVGMPQIRQGVLSEDQMWGITPIDQLNCRIQYKQLEYKGDFTPPSTNWYLFHPSPFGTMNWGGISIDKVHDLMIVNDMRIMMKAKLIERNEVNTALAKTGKVGAGVAGIVPLEGTPYGVSRAMVTSPIGVPCSNPPFGTMTAIDLKTKKIVWQRSLGTPEQLAPIAAAKLPVPLGMPSLGGPVATASGLIFYSGTADYYLRAMDVTNGNELWKTPLPVGAQSTPLVFTSPSTKKQYVVVTAGGGRTAPERGDYIIAYALE